MKDIIVYKFISNYGKPIALYLTGVRSDLYVNYIRLPQNILTEDYYEVPFSYFGSVMENHQT